MRPVRMHLKGLSEEWRRARPMCAMSRDRKERSVDLIQKSDQPSLVRSGQNDHATTVLGRKTPIIEKIVIQTNQRSAKLARHPEVLEVSGTSQPVILYHRQHIPVEAMPHV